MYVCTMYIGDNGHRRGASLFFFFNINYFGRNGRESSFHAALNKLSSHRICINAYTFLYHHNDRNRLERKCPQCIVFSEYNANNGLIKLSYAMLRIVANPRFARISTNTSCYAFWLDKSRGFSIKCGFAVGVAEWIWTPWTPGLKQKKS